MGGGADVRMDKKTIRFPLDESQLQRGEVRTGWSIVGSVFWTIQGLAGKCTEEVCCLVPQHLRPEIVAGTLLRSMG